MTNTIECAGFIESSCDDGPGVRSVLFLQGCTRNCKNCQNKKIKEHGKGKTMIISDTVELIKSKCRNKKITISGGEPMEQKESLIELVRILKNEEFNVCVYTGWQLEMIPRYLINMLDFIKTGEFIKELSDVNLQYVGSKNQHMYEIRNGKITEMNLIA